MKKFILFPLVLITIGCNMAKKEPTAAAPQSEGGSPVLAKLDGQPITEEEVRKVSGAGLARAEAQLYEARREGVENVLEDRLLTAEATSQKTTKEELIKKRVADKINVTDAEIQKFYNEKKSQMGGKGIEEMKVNIRGYLQREKYQQVYGELIAKLKKKSDLEILIHPPKVEIDEGDAPAMGPKDAPIRLVEFTDYQCPFCSRARPTINQVLGTYKGKVRYVLKDFPLSFHRESEKAHEAAHCAGEQGKYWELNKKIWDNQKSIKPEDLKKYATELKLNTAKFNECLDSGKFQELVQTNQQQGEQLGVSGTPAFFVNGRMISGARPFEDFKEVIDDELSRR